MLQFFNSRSKKLKLPIFFPDATRAFVKAVDLRDLELTSTPGILVNTYHLYNRLGISVIKKFGDIRQYMNWDRAVISDSGGFQIMSLAKKTNSGFITDKGVTFVDQGKKITLTPEDSIKFQLELKTDLVVVLDDFTPPTASFREAEETVTRTILWAERCKKEFDRLTGKKIIKEKRPYLIAVSQGGRYPDLRKRCIEGLLQYGFDGIGFGGLPITDGKFNYDIVKLVADLTPDNLLLYGLGIGKPHEIVSCCDMGYQIFDCVLPTRDARHGRLYVYNASSIDKIDVHSPDFYSYYSPAKEKYYKDPGPVSTACDCLLCKNYSRSYLTHLFRSKEVGAFRLATIHNLRFYSILMEKLRTF